MLHLVMHKNYRTFHLEVGDSHWLVEGLECELKEVCFKSKSNINGLIGLIVS